MEDVLISLVQQTPFLYDKSQKDFKDGNKKKLKWREIAECIVEICQFGITGKAAEKRWGSLRDMFSREHKRKTSYVKSGSGALQKKDWEFYSQMSFLIPHISHRRTSRSISDHHYYTEADVEKLDMPEEGEYSAAFSAEEISVSKDVHSDAEPFPNEETRKETWSKLGYKYSAASPSPSTSTLSSGAPRRMSVEIGASVCPPADKFGRTKRRQDDALEQQFVQASSVISKAAESVSAHLKRPREAPSGYLLAVEEGLKNVPAHKKTECIIKVLQIIKDYEVFP